MDPVQNPYAPGAGSRPAALVGRDAAIEDWDVALRRIERRGRSSQPFVLYGLRGVGKTVLLEEFRRKAHEREWIVAKVEASPDVSLRRLLAEALYAPLMDLARPNAGMRILKALKTLASFKASYDSSGAWTFGLDLSSARGGGADTGVLETDLRMLAEDLAGAAEDEGVGLGILIDEAQDLPRDELATLCAIAHAATQEERHVQFALAGLPSLPSLLAEARSYTERFHYTRIEQLTPEAVVGALTIPADEEGVRWEEAATELVVRESGCYPYFLQQFGYDTWDGAAGPDVISLEDARLGVAVGKHKLDNGFFRSRWDRATRAEQTYLRQMALDGDAGSQTAVVAERLGRSPSSLGPTRAKLIGKGLVYAPEHGVVAFTVPGMAAFIDRQTQ